MLCEQRKMFSIYTHKCEKEIQSPPLHLIEKSFGIPEGNAGRQWFVCCPSEDSASNAGDSPSATRKPWY